MKNAIILHGMPSKEDYYNPNADNESDCHWINWLQRQLMVRDIYTATPEMPLSYRPDYEIWKKEFERYDVTPETILVGHSCGGGFLVRWLSEQPDVAVGKVVLVAPWINVDHEVDIAFFDGLKIDSTLMNRTKGVTIFISDDDDESIHKSVQQIVSEVPGIKRVDFKGYGHFCYGDMKTKEFPELLKEITSS